MEEEKDKINTNQLIKRVISIVFALLIKIS